MRVCYNITTQVNVLIKPPSIIAIRVHKRGAYEFVVRAFPDQPTSSSW